MKIYQKCEANMVLVLYLIIKHNYLQTMNNTDSAECCLLLEIVVLDNPVCMLDSRQTHRPS